MIVVPNKEESRPTSASSNLVLDSSNMSAQVPNNAHHGGSNSNIGDSSDPDVQALKELLHKEEKRLSVLKTIHDLQGAVVASTKSSIQGSALNKKGSRPSNGGGGATGGGATTGGATTGGATTGGATTVAAAAAGSSAGGGGSGRSSPNLRPAKPKHSIVVVPGQQLKTSSSTSSSSTSSSLAIGISSRLQQLVDNIAVDQALTSCSERLNSSGKDTATVTATKVSSVTTPPVPGLTSIVPSQKHSLSFISSSSGGIKATSAESLTAPIRPVASNTTNIRSSHEVITISDSPVSKNPPPLLSSTAKMHITTNGMIQVPTISSTVVPSTASSNSSDKNYLLHAAEQSRRYREYLLKQNHAKRNFQKQIERKMVVAPYPKTFRQVWPLIPVHDSAFVRNYGLEAISHHFDPTSSTSQDRAISKVKPICNQCGCDFASAWQIRKSNSKQLLLCEACDFQNLKILQRSKLGNQLKELLESIKKEEEKFGLECEEARKQVLMLEKKAAESPPPLLTNNNISNFIGQTKKAVLDNQISSRVQALANTANATSSSLKKQVQHQTLAGKFAIASRISSSQHSTASAIPSILGQRSSTMSLKKEAVVVGLKRKDPPPRGGSSGQQESTPPPSKVYKPGSTLDLTLTRLSKQLITRKLDEQRKECGELKHGRERGKASKEIGCTKPDSEGAGIAKAESIASADGGVLVSIATATPGTTGEKSKSRRKGTPKHRLCSASSD